MTGNKQWKKGYSVRLEQKSQKSFKKICSANFLERFLRFLFKTYQLSLFSIVYSRPPLPPMAVVVAGTIQGKAGKPGKAGKAGKTGPGQTKPRLGTTGKPAKQFRAEN